MFTHNIHRELTLLSIESEPMTAANIREKIIDVVVAINNCKLLIENALNKNSPRELSQVAAFIFLHFQNNEIPHE
jgi:tRNA U34 5-methylaminomethyl-2-thiouridine-forming methyltransferase MnmC